MKYSSHFLFFYYFCTQIMEKQQKYDELLPQLEALVTGETDETAVMANVCSVLADKSPWLWTGFYRVVGDELLLGPFQGPVACFHIKYGRGVCGTAWQQARTIVVPDVEAFPGHIACSSRSRSEIVVPLMDRLHTVRAVLDIDSEQLNAFDETDRCNLERVCKLLSSVLYDREK